MRFLNILFLTPAFLITGCAVHVEYFSQPAGATIAVNTPSGGIKTLVLPTRLEYSGVTDEYKSGGCMDVLTPETVWPDGVKLNPYPIRLCQTGRGHLYSHILKRPTVNPQSQAIPLPQATQTIPQNIPNQSSNSFEDAKRKCSDLGFKSGTEQFGKCVLQLSK